MLDLANVCEAFHLGGLIRFHRVRAGKTNQVYCVRTARGTYAVKQMIARTDQSGYIQRIEDAYAIECEAYARGILMPTPVPEPSTGRCLARIDGHLVRVHHWLRGTRVRAERSPVFLAASAGRTLASVHGASKDVSPPASRRVNESRVREASYWHELADEAALAAPRLASQLRGCATEIGDLALRVRPNDTMIDPVASHADLDPSNCLITVDGSLAVIDWDAARVVSAHRELVQVALYWAIPPHGLVDQARLSAVIAGYATVRRLVGLSGAQIFDAWVGTWLRWLEFNVRSRVLGGALVRTGNQEARYAMRLLRSAARSLDKWQAVIARAAR